MKLEKNTEWNKTETIEHTEITIRDTVWYKNEPVPLLSMHAALTGTHNQWDVMRITQFNHAYPKVYKTIMEVVKTWNQN